MIAKPLARAVKHHAESAALAPAAKTPAPVVHRMKKRVAPARLSRARTGVFVLNGNGISGAAGTKATSDGVMSVPGR